MVVSSNDIWYEFEAALLIEADRAGVVLMHHQHEPIWPLFGVSRPLASHSLPFGDQMGHELSRVSPFRVTWFAAKTNVDP